MELPEQYTYLHIKNDEDNRVFRVKDIHDGPSAEVWIEEFCKINVVTWRVLKTYPKCGMKNLYRKDFRCQHFTDKRATGCRPSKNTNCPARLEVTVKRFLKRTRAKAYNAEFPAIIILKGMHNHPINTAESLRYRDMSEDTKQKLSHLFRQGYTPSSAYHLLKMDLMIEYGDDYYKVAADGKYLPTSSVVYKLFQREFEEEYRSMSADIMHKNLEILMQEYNERSGGKGRYQKTTDGMNYFIVLCTPIMLRCHIKLSQSSELTLLDASGGMDKQRHRMYVLVTPTAASGLPLGVIITDAEKESVLTEALTVYKDLLGKDAFYGKTFPKIFLTDNDLKERNSLRQVFPESSLLLCKFYILKSMWSWLCNKSHGINSSHRQELYFLFKKILYSSNEQIANDNISLFLNEINKYGYDNLANHFCNLWKYKNDWANCYRKNLATCGNTTTNYVEVVFRIIKDIIFDRMMAYNVIQLVNFIVTRYEAYMRQRLIDFCNGRYANSLLKKMLRFAVKSELEINEGAEEGIFEVKEDTNLFTVDMIRGLCTCPIGSCGRICRHLSAVVLKLDESSTVHNIVNNETKNLILFIAQGIEPPTDWFQPLKPHRKNIKNKEKNNIHYLDHSTQEHNTIIENTENISKNIEPFEGEITQEERNEFNQILERIKNGLVENPQVFIPAYKQMVKNSKVFAKTEAGLVSAMHTFGKYTGLASKSYKQKIAKTLIRRSHRTAIGVQPTAISRRKLLSAKRRGNIGRPSYSGIPLKLKEYYTMFGNLPRRKKCAPHDLEQLCI